MLFTKEGVSALHGVVSPTQAYLQGLDKVQLNKTLEAAADGSE